WTLAMRWRQTIAEEIQGFGGRIVQPVPALLIAVFGLPQTLEQMPQRAVQATLAIRHQLADAWSPDSGQPGPEVRMAMHLGHVLGDGHAREPGAALVAV